MPAACSTPLRGAENYRIVTIEMPVDKGTENLFPGFVAATAATETTRVASGDAHSAGGSDGGQGDANSAGKSGDVNSGDGPAIGGAAGEPPHKKKQEKEPDAVPSSTYKSILAA